MNCPTVYIDGVALWAPTLPGWPAARAAFRGEASAHGASKGGRGQSQDAAPASTAARALAGPPAPRPVPALLPPAERRRAPDSVALALEVATQAVAQAGLRPADLASVFTSAHGDLATTDAMCSTLARTPALLSPTRFHNSVHNAASGYWGIATGCRQPSIALSAFECSFAAGLLEALTQCAADARPILLVGYDTAACGALVSTNESRGLLAVALVIAPQRGAASVAGLDWALAPGRHARIPLRSEAALPLASNAMADALPLFEALACDRAAGLALPLSARLSLRLQLGALA